jgi:hypothetical protein
VSASEDRPVPSRRWLRIAALIAIGLVVIAAVAVIVPLFATSTADFFSRYHLLNRRFVNLEASAHEGIGCRACHETEPLANGTALVGDFYRSFVTTDTEKLPRYFQFKPPTNEACLNCHRDDWSNEASRTAHVPHPAHLRVSSETRECVKCHKWTAHLEPYIAKHKTMPFSGVCVAYGCHVGTKTTDECFNCHHVLRNDAEQWKKKHPEIVAVMGENACLEKCHKVEQCQQCHTTGKTPEFKGLTVQTTMKSIEELHVKPEWTSTYHGPEALKDTTRCLLCHQSKAECDECHLQRPAFHGSTDTWIGRHAKAAKGLDDPRCLTCHKKTWCDPCHQQFKEMQ